MAWQRPAFEGPRDPFGKFPETRNGEPSRDRGHTKTDVSYPACSIKHFPCQTTINLGRALNGEISGRRYKDARDDLENFLTDVGSSLQLNDRARAPGRGEKRARGETETKKPLPDFSGRGKKRRNSRTLRLHRIRRVSRRRDALGDPLVPVVLAAAGHHEGHKA